MNIPTTYVATSTGLVPRKRQFKFVENPNCLTYGVVVLTRDGKLANLIPFTPANRELAIKSLNRLVLDRRSKSERCVVEVIYGVKPHEYLSKDYKRKQAQNNKKKESVSRCEVEIPMPD